MTQRDAIVSDLDRIAAKKQAVFSDLKRMSKVGENTASLWATYRHIGLSVPVEVPKCFDLEVEEKRSEMRMLNFETIMPVTKDELASVASTYDMKVVRTSREEVIYSIPYRGEEGKLNEFMNYQEGWWGEVGYLKSEFQFHIMAHNDDFGKLDTDSEAPVLLFYEANDLFFLVSSWGNMKYDRFHEMKAIMNGIIGSFLKALFTISLLTFLSIKVSFGFSLGIIVYMIMALFNMPLAKEEILESSLCGKEYVFHIPRRRMWIWHLFPMRIWSIKLKNKKDCNQ
jgi:hypothetical protein